MKSEEKELIEVFVNFVNDYKGEDIHIPDYLKDVFFSINSNEPSEPEAVIKHYPRSKWQWIFF